MQHASEETRKPYKTFARKTEWITFERPRSRWEDNIKVDLKQIRCE
jgi:hypothetical protein